MTINRTGLPMTALDRTKKSQNHWPTFFVADSHITVYFNAI